MAATGSTCARCFCLPVALVVLFFVLGLFLVFFLYGPSGPGIRPFLRRATFQLMVFRRARRRPREALDRIGMNVRSAIHPSPAPRMVVDDQHVVSPIEVVPAEAPSPGTKRQANRHSKTEADASAHEGLDEIYKLISENASRATWNDIYTRLMGNLQSTSAQLKPPATGKEEPAKRKEDGVVGLRTTREATELKTRLGAAVRRSLWL